MNEQEFINEIKNITKKLEKGNRYALMDLRKVVRPINLLEIYSNWQDDGNKFLIYFLKTFIDDFWRNLAVDNIYELTSKEQKDISSIIGKNIREIVISAEKNNLGNDYKALSDVMASYFKLLSDVENKLGKM